MIIPSGEQSPVNTGITLAVPLGTYTMIALWSGLEVKHVIDIGAGVIDEDYWEEIKVVLINNSSIPFQVRPGDRNAQLILGTYWEPFQRKRRTYQKWQEAFKDFVQLV
jgi:dUTP pyrophosphatase